MQSLKDALRKTISSIPSASEDYTCPICEQIVPKRTVSILGIEKLVQPRCQCEVAEYESGVTEAVERKRKHDIERKFAFSALGERFNESHFENFTAREGTEHAVKMAMDYANNFERYGDQSLLIWGTPGNGKSFLAASVCHTLKEKGYISIFQSVPELLERIRSTFRKGGESEKEIMTALKQCDLLVLDDIGAEKISDWVLDVLFRIIDGRYRAKKPTMFTTNFSPSELNKRFQPEKPSPEQEIAGNRIYSRILEVSIIVENKATDYRKEVAHRRVREWHGMTQSTD